MNTAPFRTSRFSALGKIHLHWDLGVRQLFQEWKTCFKREGLRADLNAGLTVACIALPLSFAVAIASGVEPKLGLVTAIVGGMVCAITGGVPLAVSGPTVTIAVMIAAAEESAGMPGVLFVGLICGVLQLLTGIFGLGKVMRLVPTPVVAGFTAGVGAIIVIGQLPRALGLPPPAQSHVIEVLRHLKDLVGHMQPMVFVVALFSIWVMIRLPKIAPRIPASLAAVALPTFLVWGMGLTVPLLGEIPRGFPVPTMPEIPANWSALLTTGFIIYCLASLETLLSAGAVDKLSRGKKHDPDQEMIGQGLANLITPLFGGIAATGVMARSALNVQAGAKTRRAAFFHSLFLVAMIFFLDPLIGSIPLASLAGVLLVVAFRMIQPQEMVSLWRRSPGDALIYSVTFLGVVFADLLAGVQSGVAVAAVIALVRLSHTQLFVYSSGPTMPQRFSLEGPLSFLTVSTFESIRKSLQEEGSKRGVIFDVTQVTDLDTTAAASFAELVSELQQKQVRVSIKGLARPFEEVLLSVEEAKKLAPCFSATDAEAFQSVAGDGRSSAEARLSYGVEIFRQRFQDHHQGVFEKLESQQNPHTLFITCADSRILPNLITGSEPGDLFTMRNIGNFVPPFGSDGTPAEGAAVEFAVGVLGVRNIVVCGHSSCGAMKACVAKEPFTAYPSIHAWMAQIHLQMGPHVQSMELEQACQTNIVNQISNLKSYPIVQSAMGDGLKISGWYYEMSKGSILQWSPHTRKFEDLAETERLVSQLRADPL